MPPSEACFSGASVKHLIEARDKNLILPCNTFKNIRGSELYHQVIACNRAVGLILFINTLK